MYLLNSTTLQERKEGIKTVSKCCFGQRPGGGESARLSWVWGGEASGLPDGKITPIFVSSEHLLKIALGQQHSIISWGSEIRGGLWTGGGS